MSGGEGRAESGVGSGWRGEKERVARAEVRAEVGSFGWGAGGEVVGGGWGGEGGEGREEGVGELVGFAGGGCERGGVVVGGGAWEEDGWSALLWSSRAWRDEKRLGHVGHVMVLGGVGVGGVVFGSMSGEGA